MKWYRQKTTWTGIAGLIAAIGGYLTGEVSGSAAIAGALGALSVIFLRQGVAKLGVVLLAVTVAAGCSSLPTDGDAGPGLAKELGTSAKGPQSGDSSAATGETTLAPGISTAWGASEAHSNSMTAKYSPNQANANSGPVVTGFVQGLTAAQRKEIQSAIDSAVASNPVLQSLADELASLAGVEPAARNEAWTARIDQVRALYSEAFDHLVGALKAAGITEHLDLGNLRYLTVVSVIHQNAGHTERAPTDAEVQNLARILSNPISAARGETVVLGEGEKVEGGGD